MSTQKLKPIQKLHSVIPKLEIRDIFTTKSVSELFIHPHHVKPEQTKLDITESFEWKLDGKRSVFICSITKEVSGLSTVDVEELNIQKEKKLFSFEVTFAVVYSLREDSENPVEDEIFEMFCQTNADYNCYPYLREYINSACNRMTIRPIILPFMKPFTVQEINERFADSK